MVRGSGAAPTPVLVAQAMATITAAFEYVEEVRSLIWPSVR